jgi:hypothetical protein
MYPRLYLEMILLPPGNNTVVINTWKELINAWKCQKGVVIFLGPGNVAAAT